MNFQEIFKAVTLPIRSTSHLAHAFEREADYEMKWLVRDIKVSLGIEFLLDFAELVNIVPEAKGIFLIQFRDEPNKGIHLPFDSIERQLKANQFPWAERNYILDICLGRETVLPHSTPPAEALLLRWAEILAKASLALPENSSIPAKNRCQNTAEQLLVAFSRQTDPTEVRRSTPRKYVNLHWGRFQASLDRAFANNIHDSELRAYFLELNICRPKSLKGPKIVPKHRTA